MTVAHSTHFRPLAGCLPFLLLACSGEIGGGDSGLTPIGSGEDPTAQGEDGSSGSSTGSSSGTGSTSNGGTSGSSTGSTGSVGDVGGTGSDGSSSTGGGETSEGGNGAGLGGADTDEVSEEVQNAVANASALPLQLKGEPLFARTVRLTHAQWERSVRQLLQLDGPTGFQSGLAEDVAALTDFTNNEAMLYITGTLWNDYATAAAELAAAVATDSARLSAIYSGSDAQGFINAFGRRAFRRPLNATEVAAYQSLFDTGAALTERGATEFARGAGLVIEAMLQSPHFLYRVELGAPGTRMNGFEIATKLSLTLRGVIPDDALLDQAAAGAFDSDAAIASLAAQMVEEPNAVEVMREYHGELFRFNRYLAIEKDRLSVPQFTPSLTEELQEAAYLFFDRIYNEGLGVRDMLLSNVGYAGPEMAELYELPGGQGFTEITFGPERPGFFTQLPFLILNSVNMVPDSIHRGVALNLEVLCAEVPPPTDTSVTLPSEQSGQTNRERVDGATGPGTCGAACHGNYINPLGFAFENFDGLGQLRGSDNGNPVDTASSYPFVEGTQSFDGAPALMQIMAESEQAHACYAKHLAGFALQRDLTADDRPLIDNLTAASRAPGGSVKQLLLALATDPAFVTTRGAQ